MFFVEIFYKFFLSYPQYFYKKAVFFLQYSFQAILFYPLIRENFSCFPERSFIKFYIGKGQVCIVNKLVFCVVALWT